MKKFINHLALMAIAVCATSCGSSDSVKLEIENELGSLGKYISVNEKEATLTMKDGEIVSSLPLTVETAVATDYSFDFDVEILDKEHIKICSLSKYDIDHKYDWDNKPYNDYLEAGNIRAVMKSSAYIKDWEKICKEGKYIVLKPAFDSAKYTDYVHIESVITDADDSSVENITEIVTDDDDSSTADSEPTVTASASGAEDWNKVLDSYESYVNQYISYLKKAKNGDMSALTEYPALMQKANEFSEKLSKAQSDLSPAQFNRYMSITTKLSSAATNL